jgi:hypothetical protein
MLSCLFGAYDDAQHIPRGKKHPKTCVRRHSQLTLALTLSYA